MAENLQHEHYIKPYSGGPLEHDKCILRSHYLLVFHRLLSSGWWNSHQNKLHCLQRAPSSPNYQWEQGNQMRGKLCLQGHGWHNNIEHRTVQRSRNDNATVWDIITSFPQVKQETYQEPHFIGYCYRPCTHIMVHVILLWGYIHSLIYGCLRARQFLWLACSFRLWKCYRLLYLFPFETSLHSFFKSYAT